MLGWEVMPIGGSVKYDVVNTDKPLHDNTPHALELKISSLNADGKTFYLTLVIGEWVSRVGISTI
jgi:hypothetical protein